MQHDTRRSFLERLARLSAAAGFAQLGTLPAFATEPQNCAGPKPPATPLKWTPDANPILPRLSASTLGAADATKLTSAYAALRNLAASQPDDPRGWLQQGDKHCWNCGGGLDGQAGEEIHGGWLFFPWHRAFLYFHERILGSLINDQSLRLAYWDWDNAAHRAIPSAWATPNSPSNALWNPIRSAVAGNQAPDSLVGTPIINQILGASTFAAFGGSSSTAGSLENGPHGGIHIWCGDTTQQSAAADMGLLDTAAQDPLFFAHHANIDRLWNVWLGASASHKNPTSTAWLKHKFTFWDEQKRWVSITVADVINMSSNLRYTYGTGAAAVTTQLNAPKTRLLLSDSARALVMPQDVRQRLSAAAPDNKPTLLTLRLDGVVLPQNVRGIVRIIANRPAARAAEVTGTPNDLGYIAVVPRNSKDAGSHLHSPLTVELNVTGQLAGLLQENGKLSLSFVPMAGAATGNPLNYKNGYLVER